MTTPRRRRRAAARPAAAATVLSPLAARRSPLAARRSPPAAPVGLADCAQGAAYGLVIGVTPDAESAVPAVARPLRAL
ncbi:hypothetical protein GCM10010269_03200 [Streptomyces humidus]|uniref:Uncharacterized protein n=1 Tax=Streptomyces humidus TaxID=52259 RepID=A0A918FQF6_9ACTN|nr:hypothetical protein [Streptomyces humidus]GGR67754.1 hypothetical protein GCM10010269_03200 [Streptomyces humidus]